MLQKGAKLTSKLSVAYNRQALPQLQHMLDIDMTARMPMWLKHTRSQSRTLWRCTLGD